MRILLIAVAVGFPLALALGGRFVNLKGRRLRAWFLLPLGLAVQLAAVGSAGSTWPFVLVLLSFACLFAFAVANLGVTGFWMIALGLVLNAVAVGVNHGMPVGHKALAHTGNNSSVFVALRHEQRSSDRLLILGDVIPISPIGEVASFGDLILAVGLVDIIVHLMRPARRRRDEDEDVDTDPFLEALGAQTPVGT